MQAQLFVLEKKICMVPDQIPMPRVKDILDNLGGQYIFTTLDMIKVYRYGFMHEPSSPLATFTFSPTSVPETYKHMFRRFKGHQLYILSRLGTVLRKHFW